MNTTVCFLHIIRQKTVIERASGQSRATSHASTNLWLNSEHDMPAIFSLIIFTTALEKTNLELLQLKRATLN